MKKRMILQKTNKILAAVMTASMLMTSIVPGTAAYASEISEPDMEVTDGFSDGTAVMEEEPVILEEQGADNLEFDDGSLALTADETVVKVGTWDGLRDAVKNSADNTCIQLTSDINIPSGAYTLSVHHNNLTIDLGGYTITGNGEKGIFNIFKDYTFYLKNGILTGGCAFAGGAIKNEGNTTVENVTIRGNTAKNGGGICNGMSNQKAVLTLRNVTINNNTASNAGGGIHNYYSSINLENVIIQNNTANDSSGGGIYTCARNSVNASATLILNNVTIQNNASKTQGGGIQADLMDGKQLILKNDIIITGNTSTGNNTDNLNLLRAMNGDFLPVSIDSESGLGINSNIGVTADSFEVKESGTGIVGNFKREYFNYFSADNANQKIGMKADDNDTLYVASKNSTDIEKPSPHEWNYTEEGNIIKVSCSTDKCVENSLVLELNVGDMYYSGEAYNNAVITNHSSEIQETTGDTITIGDIVYTGRGATDYTESKTAPTNAGTYTAKVTVTIGGENTYTATADFEIKKIDPTIEFAENLVFDSNEKQLVLNTPSGVTIEYQVNDGNWTSAIPKATLPGTYTIKYKITGNENYNSIDQEQTKIVTIVPGQFLIDLQQYSDTYDGESHSATVTVKNTTDATILYKKSTDEEYTSENPTFKDAGEYWIDYKIVKDNYATIDTSVDEKEKLHVLIQQKPVSVSGIQAEDKTYDGNTEAKLNYEKVAINGKIANDDLSINATGTFATKIVGTDKPVTLTNLSLVGADERNYSLAQGCQASTTASILPKPVTVTIIPNGGTYGDVAPAEAIFTGMIDKEDVNPVIEYSGTAYNGTEVIKSSNVPENAGIYTINVRINNSNYILDSTVENPTTAEFRIEPKPVPEDMVLVNANNKNGFDVIVTDDDIKLHKDTDYTVETAEQDGMYTITVTGKDNYKDSVVRKVMAVEKPSEGTIVTAVMVDEKAEKMQPSLKPVSQDEAKGLLINNLENEAVKNIITGNETDTSYNATVYLEMKEQTNDDDTAKINNLIQEGKKLPADTKIGKSLDLELHMSYVATDGFGNTYSGNQIVSDTDRCGQEVTLTITDDLKTNAAYTTRAYYVVCVHNGKAEVVPSTLNKDKLSFTAYKFSTYAIAYKDTYHAPSYPVTGITVSPEKATLTKEGETVQITAGITPSYADNKQIIWKSSDEKVAVVDENGKVTAVGNGSAIITATTVSNKKTATVEIKVDIPKQPVEIDQIIISTDKATLTKAGETTSLTVKIEPEDAESQKLTWKSSDEKVAAVDENGKVTAVGNGTAMITVTTEDGKHSAEFTITVKIPEDKPETPDEPVIVATTGFGRLKARSTKQTNTSITLNWSKVSDADGYIIYGNQCNSSNQVRKYEKLKTITNNSTVSWTQTKLKKGTYYKYQVKAYKVVNGKRKIIASSISVHTVTKGGKYGVAKGVSVTSIGSKKNTLTVTLRKGKTAQIKAKEVKADKPIRNHRNLCYESSNKKVATVNANGLIKAVGKGTCVIWVYAQNGVYKKLTITVK